MSGGILSGAELTAARMQRLFRMCLLSVLLMLFGASVGGFTGWKMQGEKMTAGWQRHDFAVPRIYFVRRYLPLPWFSYLADPIELVPPRSHIRFTHNQRQLDAWLFSLWSTHKKPFEMLGRWMAGGSAFGLLFFAFIAWRLSSQKEEFKRGARLVSKAKLVAKVRKATRKKPQVEIVRGVPFAFEDEYKSCLVVGTPGSGKSQWMHFMLSQIKKKGEKAIVYDPGSEFLSTHAVVGAGDCLLNPFDKRSCAWDILQEIETPMDCDAIANSAIQQSAKESGGNGEYFFQSARMVLSEALKIGKQQGIGMDELYRWLCVLPISELYQILQDTPAGPFLDPEAKGAGTGGIRATLQTKLAGWQYLQGMKMAKLGIREWINNKKSGWLYLTSNEANHASLEPLISLWTDIAAREILSREPNVSPRIWIVIDELASLQKLPSLLRLLALGRKYRCVCLLATQSPGQIVQIYGKEGAQALADTTGSKVFFRLEDGESAESASQLIGEQELERQMNGEGAGKRIPNVNFSTQRAKERAIMPSQIQSLRDLECVIKLAGGFPPARIQTKYQKFKQVRVRQMPREIAFSAPPEKPAVPATASTALEREPEPDRGWDDFGEKPEENERC